MRRFAFIAALLCVSSTVQSVLAQAAIDDDTLSIEPAPDACLNRPTLQARVVHWLGAGRVATALRVVVHTDDVRPWFSVWRGDELVAERRFDTLPRACAELRDTLAMAIAIGIEGATRSEPGSATPSTRASGTPHDSDAMPRAGSRSDDRGVSEAEKVREEASRQEPARSNDGNDDDARRSREVLDRDAENAADADEPIGERTPGPRAWRLHASSALMLETMPEPLVVFGLGAEWQPTQRFHGALTAVATLATEVELGSIPVRSRLLGGRALGCLDTGVASASLEACSGVLIARIQAQGMGFDVDHAATLSWVAVPLRLALRWPAQSMFALRAGFDLHLHVVRPRLRVVDGPMKVPLPIGGAGMIDLVFALP